MTLALKRRDPIISQIKHQSAWFHKHPNKFGIELPKMDEESYVIGHATGTILWRVLIKKEMQNALIAFDVLRDSVVPLQDH